MDEQVEAAARLRRLEEAKAWVRISSPLAMVREIREVLFTCIVTYGDEDKQLFPLLQDIAALEGRLIREAMRYDRARCLSFLNLEHEVSWLEICDLVSSDGNFRLMGDLNACLPTARKLLRQYFAIDEAD